MRFIKSFVAGFAGAIISVGITQATGISNFVSIWGALLGVGLSGGFFGLLMALQKWASWTDPIVPTNPLA